MNGIDLMAGAMHVAQARLNVAADNLANVSASGFRRHVFHAAFGRTGLSASSGVDTTPAPLRPTGRAFDLAVAGSGAVYVRGARGVVEASRGGSFERRASGQWADERGNVLVTSALRPLVAAADATVDTQGVVREGGRVVARLRLAAGTEVQSGFLAASNVDAVHEMVDVLEAQRAFETAQKTLVAIDDVRAKDASDVGRVKS